MGQQQETVEIQDVERLRRQAGIDDVDLRRQVRRLRVGDVVKLTFLAGGGKFEIIRITSVRRRRFSGDLDSAATLPSWPGCAAARR
jgi:hypothetical protein